jgi:hypothetical protein
MYGSNHLGSGVMQKMRKKLPLEYITCKSKMFGIIIMFIAKIPILHCVQINHIDRSTHSDKNGMSILTIAYEGGIPTRRRRLQFKKILKVTHLWAYPSSAIRIILPTLYYEAGSTIAQRGQANTAILRMDEARKVRTLMKFNSS